MINQIYSSVLFNHVENHLNIIHEQVKKTQLVVSKVNNKMY